MALKLLQPVDTNAGDSFSESDTDAPAVEAENARFEQLGPVRAANVAIDLGAVAMTEGGVDADATPLMVAGRAGTIVGLAYSFSAAVSAGGASAAQLQAAVGGVLKGTQFAIASGGAQAGVLDEPAAGIPFKKGDQLAVALTTSHTFAPTTDDLAVWLLVKWAI